MGERGIGGLAQSAGLAVCETEPIRFPGAVQPHGVLLVIRADSQVIEAASESCEAVLGLSAASLLEQPLGKIVGPASLAALLSGQYDGSQALVHLSLNGRELRARPGINQARQVLVDIETAGQDFSSVQGTVYKRRQVLAGLRALSDIQAIAQGTAELVRDMTGFDRVMLYRFDEEWNGEVIGEACAGNIESYLGHNFPASDIPRQARDLFKSNRMRMIPDALYVPSALIASRDARPIDLGQSSLRSVSPVHIEYLKNMGVRASLTGGLVVQGRLWGLLACHHKSGPKYFGPSVRDALGWLCEDIAALIEATLIRQLREREYGLATRRRSLVNVIRQVGFKELMQQGGCADLLKVVGADGFALLAKDSIQTAGSTPPIGRIGELQKRRRECESDPTLFASNALARDLGVAAAGDGVAGALFVSLRYRPDITMIWFRKEQDYTLRWAGDPAHPHSTDASGRISPRKSFAQFLQDVRGQCPAWAAEELESAAELGSLIEIEVLRDGEAFTQTILNSSPQRVVVLDARGLIVSVNDAWTRFAEVNGAAGPGHNSVGLSYHGIRAADGGLPGGVEAAPAWAGTEAVLNKTREHFTLDYPFDSPRARRWFRMSVYPMIAPSEGAVVAHEDITDRRAAEAELEKHRHHLEELVGERTLALTIANEAAAAAHLASVERLRVEAQAKMQSGKLEAVGTLAAGIAHDFNTILGSIVGFAEMTGDDVPEGSTARRNIAQILSASFRARDLIARMLAFARQSTVEPVPVDVVAEVREALALLRASLPPSVDLSFQSGMDEAGATPCILADPTQIQQIVMNLCINAVHAMDERGVIRLRVDPAARIKGAPPKHADGICLTVADGGRGMSPQVLERIFDPFFTTKAPGEGTGLGLSVVYGVVTDLGGVIEVQSRVEGGNTGTEFRVFLPLTKSGVRAGAMPAGLKTRIKES